MSSRCPMISVILFAALLIAFSSAVGQAVPPSTPILNFGGLATNGLSTPMAPTLLGKVGCGSTATDSYAYQVAGVDYNGGLTPFGGTLTVTCQTTLTGSPSSGVYIYMTLPSVTGSANCYITRTLNSGTPAYVGLYPCGSMFWDYGILGGTPANVPTMTNTTGGVAAAGFVNAQAFFAKGAGAGTDVLNTGTALGTCSSTTGLPCINSASEIFLQAPMSVSPSSWGITLPSAAPSTTTGYYPFLLGKLDNTQPAPASAAFVGSLSNPGASELATAESGTPGTGDIATWDSSGSLADSGTLPSVLGTAGAGIFLPSLINPFNPGTSQKLEPSAANTVSFIPFVNPLKVTIAHVTVDVATSSTGTYNIGIYTVGGTKVLDTGTVTCSAGVGSTSVSYTLQPGAYYFAYVASDTTCAMSGLPSTNSNSSYLNKNHAEMGTYSYTGGLPSTLPTITSGAVNVIFAYVEP